MNPTPETEPLLAAARSALAQVLDPEIGENLVDLGVVADVALHGQVLRVTLIPTSATCPMADVMKDDAAEAVQHVCPPGVEVRVDMDWDTVWSPDRMSPTLRERFGW
ncbi:MAG: metal-sulfur cluster assembly factor [Limnohabitans sp.]|nr:MAG: metal-sulfur cluster assembly factor [Limnohabitans sp.]